jgi:O-antigen/teichoic acid export membrane protein
VLVIWSAAMEKTRPIFISYVVSTAFALIAAYPLTRYGGLAGVVLGSLVVEIIRMIVLWIPLRHEINSSVVRRAVEATQLQAGSIR